MSTKDQELRERARRARSIAESAMEEGVFTFILSGGHIHGRADANGTVELFAGAEALGTADIPANLNNAGGRIDLKGERHRDVRAAVSELARRQLKERAPDEVAGLKIDATQASAYRLWMERMKDVALLALDPETIADPEMRRVKTELRAHAQLRKKLRMGDFPEDVRECASCGGHFTKGEVSRRGGEWGAGSFIECGC